MVKNLRTHIQWGANHGGHHIFFEVVYAFGKSKVSEFVGLQDMNEATYLSIRMFAGFKSL